jgi:hypothetical protein
MLIAALWHCADSCFGYVPFALYGHDKKTSIWKSMTDSFNPIETLRDVGLAVQHVIVR